MVKILWDSEPCMCLQMSTNPFSPLFNKVADKTPMYRGANVTFEVDRSHQPYEFQCGFARIGTLMRHPRVKTAQKIYLSGVQICTL